MINLKMVIINIKIKNLFSNKVNNHLFIINLLYIINQYIINLNSKNVYYNLNQAHILTNLVI